MAEVKDPEQVNTQLTEPELEAARSYFRINDVLVKPPTVRAAYSDRMAWILASMADLAYDRYEDDEKACELFDAKLRGGGCRRVQIFNSDATDTQAFLAANADFAVLAFRGTEVKKKKDVLTDLRATQISAIEGGLRVHKGFQAAYDSVKDEIEKSLATLDQKLPIYITGHSLGAALATVATKNLDVASKFKDRIAACYTFGSPRVGNTKYDRAFKAPIYRTVNTTDIVTVIPLLAMGYVHIGDIRYLGRKPGEFSRQIPFLLRSFLFLIALVRLFGPWVGDHAIDEYRRKLGEVSEKRNNVVRSQ